MPRASKLGRPSKMTRETLKKLEEAFTSGLNDREACLYADISTSILYSYCEMFPAFYERKELLKDSVRMIAKMNVQKAIKKGDKPISQWYLERKAKDEFSIRTETQNTGSITFEVMKYDENASLPAPIKLIEAQEVESTPDDVIRNAKELRDSLIQGAREGDI